MDQKLATDEVYQYIGRIHLDFHLTMKKIQEEASAKIKELLEQIRTKDKRIKELESREGNTTDNSGNNTL